MPLAPASASSMSINEPLASCKNSAYTVRIIAKAKQLGVKVTNPKARVETES